MQLSWPRSELAIVRCMKAPLFSDPELELRSPLPLPLLLVWPPGFRKGIWLHVKDALTDTFSNCPPGTEASRHLLRGHLTHWEHAVQEQKVRGVAEEPGELAAERGSDLLPSSCTDPQWQLSCKSRSRRRGPRAAEAVLVFGNSRGGTISGLSHVWVRLYRLTCPGASRGGRTAPGGLPAPGEGLSWSIATSESGWVSTGYVSLGVAFPEESHDMYAA